MVSAQLVSAYRDTNFGVEDGAQSFVLRLGEPSPRLAELLSPYPDKGAVYITAWNPFSQVASEQQNQRANDRLRAELYALGLVVMQGQGASRDGHWHEDSLLAFPLDRHTASKLGETYGQNAVVYVDASGTPELVFPPAP